MVLDARITRRGIQALVYAVSGAVTSFACGHPHMSALYLVTVLRWHCTLGVGYSRQLKITFRLMPQYMRSPLLNPLSHIMRLLSVVGHRIWIFFGLRSCRFVARHGRLLADRILPCLSNAVKVHSLFILIWR